MASSSAEPSTPQRHIELILLRQLGHHLAMAAFFVDRDGNLLFYNEAAEPILGMRYEETGEMAAAEWSTKFLATYEDGEPMPPGDLPLMRTMETRLPAHGEFWITGADGQRHFIAVTAIPFIGHGGRDVGSLALFWEAGLSSEASP